MEAVLMLDCVDDDQLLVLMAYKDRPDLFEVHVNGWNLAIKLCGGDHMRAKEITQAPEENPVKRALSLAVRKVIPNPADPKRNYAKRCYENAIKFYGK